MLTKDPAASGTPFTVTFGDKYKPLAGLDFGEASSVAELIATTFRILKDAEGYAIAWYRGVGDADWPVIPQHLIKYGLKGERLLFNEFQSAAKIRRDLCPHNDDVAAWCSLMQHHGLATRLLDWSSSLLVAAYFVVWNDTRTNPSKRPGAVWVTCPGILNKNLTGCRGLRRLDTEHFFSLRYPHDRTGLVCAAKPQHCDIRMMVQHGNFTVHDNETPLEEIPEGRMALRRIIIPPASRPNLKMELELCGISRESMFPDFDNLAHHLKDKISPASFDATLTACEEKVISAGKWFTPDGAIPPFAYPELTRRGWRLPPPKAPTPK